MHEYNSMVKPALYFKGLNGLRFIAALLVIISHAPTFVTAESNPNIFDFRNYSFFNNGYLAVDFFFVLSGFLITSLLLKEREDTGTISIKKFYMRRVLRIWPLYYLVVFIAFVIFPILANTLHLKPDPGLGITQLILYIFLLPNATFIFGPRILLFSLWSIGVEEQFYLIVAPVIKSFKAKLAEIFIAVIIVKLLINILVDHFYPETNLRLFILDLRFEVISVGCLGAIFITSKYKHLLNKLFTYPFQVVLFATLFAILFFNKTIPSSNIPFISALFNLLLSKACGGTLTGFIFLYVILSTSLNDKSLIKTNNKPLEFLGNISYGMYMYHVMVCFVCTIIMKYFFPGFPTIPATFIYYLLCMSLTMLIAFFSYIFFEKKFLKLKTKFV